MADSPDDSSTSRSGGLGRILARRSAPQAAAAVEVVANGGGGMAML